MEWQQPKTDWQENNYFNPEDYNRIKNNLIIIRQLAVEAWSYFEIEEMGEDKTYSDYYYADEINRFEDNIEKIREHTLPFQTGDRQVFYENQPFIDWKELNRIEKACLLIYQNILGCINGRKTLEFTLNGGDF